MVLLTDIGWHLCWTVLVTELPVLSSKLGNSGRFRVIRCSAKSNEKGKARMEPYGWAPLHTSTALVIWILPQSLWASDCFLYFQWPYVTWSSLHRSWIHICQLPRLLSPLSCCLTWKGRMEKVMPGVLIKGRVCNWVRSALKVRLRSYSSPWSAPESVFLKNNCQVRLEHLVSPA